LQTYLCNLPAGRARKINISTFMNSANPKKPDGSDPSTDSTRPTVGRTAGASGATPRQATPGAKKPKTILEAQKPRTDSIWGDPQKQAAFDPQGIHEEQGPRSKLGYIAVFLLLLLIAGGVFWYRYIQKKVVAPTVSVAYVQGVDKIYSGLPFNVTLSISNTSNDALETVRLSLLLPDGVYFAGSGQQDQRFMEHDIGAIGPGSIRQESFSLIAGGGAQTILHLQATLSYASQKLASAQFEEKSDIAITIDQPAVKFSLVAPGSVYNGQRAELKISYENNVAQDLKGLKIHLDIPDSLKVASTTLPTDPKTNNEWTFDLPQNGSGTISIFGVFIGQENAVYNVGGRISISYNNSNFDIMSLTTPVSIRTAPLSLGVSVNGSTDYVAHAGEELDYIIAYENNSNVPIKSATIQASFLNPAANQPDASGTSPSVVSQSNSLFDYTSVSTNGSFDSLGDIITWRTSDTPNLSSIDPGQGGTVDFKVRLKNSFPVVRMADKNFSIGVDATIESPTVPENTTADNTFSEASIKTKVTGNLNFRALGLWKDAPSKIINNGLYPPHVNQATQYTVHWILSSVASDMSSIHVSAFLSNGTRFTGTVKGNAPTLPQYDQHTGEVTWDVATIPANTGVLAPPYEAIFQIENTPSVNQAGKEYELVGKSALTARDQYGALDISLSAPSIGTSLPDDPAATAGNRGIQP
jgi:hypothetical protein